MLADPTPRQLKQRAYSLKWRRKHHARCLLQDKAKRERKRAALLKISVEELQALKAKGCELCGSHRRLSVDHDHKTGIGRGVVCSACNAKLAWYENRIEKIAEYLKRGHNGD